MADSQDNLLSSIRIIVKASLLQMDGDYVLPTFDNNQPPTSSDDIINYARKVAFDVAAIEVSQLTYDALQQFAGAIVAAHAAAALVIVAEPTVNQISALKSALNTLSSDVKGDQRFAAAVGLAQSAANALGSLQPTKPNS